MTLLYLTLAWAGGILLSHLLWSQGIIGCGTPFWPFGLACGTAAVALLLLRRQPVTRLVAAAVLFLLLGMWRYDVHPFVACPTPTDVAFYNGQNARVEIEGVVTGYPDARETYTHYTLSAESVTIGGQARAVHGQVLIQAPRFPAYRYGDRLRATGRLQEPPVFDDFDYRFYLARSGIYSLMRLPKTERIVSDQGSAFWSRIYGLREQSSQLIDRLLPEPTAALANGMLLGIEGGIPTDLYDTYRTAGVAHVIVISGSNISLLAGVLAFLIARPFGRRRAVVPVLLGVVLYVLLAGAQPPAVRAGLMAILFLVAVAIGRQSTAWVSLAAVALLMSAYNPLTLWDASFQLSFMATLGLILFTPPMTAALERWLQHRALPERAAKWARVPAALLIATIAAQLLVTPLMLYYFRRLSLVSLPANLLVLPAQPPVMAGGMATLIGGLIWEPAGRVLASVPWVFLTYTNAVVKIAASIPLASVETGAPSVLLVLLFYVVLFGVLVQGWRSSATRSGGTATLPAARAVGWATAVVVPLWLGLSVLGGAPDGRLHVVYGTEGSQTTLVITPGGRRLWIGVPSLANLGQLGGANRIGGGLPPQHPEVVISPGAAEIPGTGVETIDPTQLPPGTTIKTGDGVTLMRLDAGEGWVLGLHYGQFRTLLPPNLSQESQAALLAGAGEGLHASLLKAPGTSDHAWPTLEFLTAVAPQLTLWTEDAAYAPGVEAWLVEHDALRIPVNAEVEVITDGERMWLAQRSGPLKQ